MNKRDRVLGLLRIANRPLSAPEIRDICGFWSFGSLYNVLIPLEKRRVIESEWGVGHYSGQRVRLYRLGITEPDEPHVNAI